MLKQFKAFWADQTGAITVDWVVLTAAMVAMCLAMIVVVHQGMVALAVDTSDAVSNMEVGSMFLASAEDSDDGTQAEGCAICH